MSVVEDIFEVRTDAGGIPTQIKVGRIWRRGAGVRVLERWSPDGLLLPSASNPWIVARRVESAPELTDLSPLRPATFEYRRRGATSWELVSVEGDSATMNGAELSRPELDRLLRNLRQGVAEIRYAHGVPEKAPFHQAWKVPKAGTDADLTIDSVLGLSNLLAFETAAHPISWFSLRSYDRLWARDPSAAIDLARSLAAAAKESGGQWYHLWCGQFAREISDEQEGLTVASAVARYLAKTVAGAAGLADVLVVLPSDSEPDFGSLAARCPSGSACLVGDRVVAL